MLMIQERATKLQEAGLEEQSRIMYMKQEIQTKNNDIGAKKVYLKQKYALSPHDETAIHGQRDDSNVFSTHPCE